MEEEEFEFPMVTASKGCLSRRKLVFGVGINDSWYITQTKIEGKNISCPYYSKWMAMIRRCYSSHSLLKHPTYKDCTVCEEWLTFSNFKRWMEKQDWKGKQLDKDIIIPNNKVYSPQTCVFVNHRVNKLLLDSGKSRGVYKQGVYIQNGKFIARCNNGTGGSNFLGHFPTEAQAYEAYVTYKHTLILQVANEQEDERVKNGLLLHAQLLLDTLNEEF